MLDFYIKKIEDSIGTADFYIWTDRFLSFLNGADNGISPDLAQRLRDIDPNNFIEDHKSYVDMLKKVCDVYYKRSPDVHTDDTHLMPAGMSIEDPIWFCETEFRVEACPVKNNKQGGVFRNAMKLLREGSGGKTSGFVVGKGRNK